MVKVEVKDGEVIVDRSDESMDAFEGMNLIADDYVGVKEKSYIVLLVDDDKHISAEENTEFSVNATGTKSNGSVTVELVKGQALFEIDEKLDENSYFSVKTPNTTLSVRGTTFTVYYDDTNDVTYLEVSEGIVNIETNENNLSEDVTAGEKREIKSGSVESIEAIPQRNDENKKPETKKRLIKETEYDADGTIRNWKEYEYNSNGNIIKYTSYNADGTISYRSESEYDANGNKIKSTSYMSGGMSSWFEYEYDSNGKCIKVIIYNADGTIRSWFEYEYDANGNEIKQTIYNADGTISNWSEYEYDANGNMIKRTNYMADGMNSWSEHEYDAEGNTIKSTYYKSDGNIDCWYIPEYE